MAITGQNIVIYYKRYGLKATVMRILDKLTGNASVDYKVWSKKMRTGEKELDFQRRYSFSYTPKITVVVPLEEVCGDDTAKFKESLQAQTYSKWELYEAPDITDEVDILEHTSGDYILFLGRNDLLASNAFYEYVKALNEDDTIDVIYSDEDQVDAEGKEYYAPAFKPDFSIDMLRSTNYIHYVLVKRELFTQLGGIDQVDNMDREYDYVLRCAEHAANIKHIPKILYHVRAGKKPPEAVTQIRAIKAHYSRVGIHASVKETKYSGIYRSRYILEEKPTVSIVIPNKDHIGDLEKCICSLEEKNSYQNVEYIIVENNSTQKSTFEYYKKLERECPRARVLYWQGRGFNYPEINNYGAGQAKGEYILFLNNDTSIMGSDCIEEMLGYCMREDVGAVGARLYYEDGTLQHVGVIVGLGGIAGHPYSGDSAEEPGHMGRIQMAQNLSAVTAACMMVKRTVFMEVGGFDPEYAVAFNDVDLCMKIRKKGYLIVYNPYARLTHYESKSRGLEDSRQKVKRFDSEVALFRERWGEFLKNGDPYYNPNLRLDEKDFKMNIHAHR